MKRRQIILWVGLSVIIVAGVVIRLLMIGAHPDGLYRDEAYNGLDALRVLEGDIPLYFTANNGREPLFIYAMAGTVAVFGRTVVGVRVAAAVFGVLLLPTMYYLGATWGERQIAGLLAAAATAVMLWPLHLSRVGFRAIALPVLLALALALGAAGLKKRSQGMMAGAGAVYGLAFYTYVAVQLTPLALLASLAYGVVWQRDWLRDHWRLLMWAALGAIVVALPLAGYYVMHASQLMARSGQVALWESGTTSLGGNILKTAGMFVWQGDLNWRHNVAGRPVYDPLLGVVFLAGVVFGIWRWKRCPTLAISIIWLVVMVLPTTLSVDAPHFLRAAGAIPFAAMIPALALGEGLEWVERHHARLRKVGAASVVAVLGISGGLTARAYFGPGYRQSAERGFYFQEQAVELAKEIELQGESPVILSRRYWDTFPSVRFLVRKRRHLILYTEGERLEQRKPPFTLLAWPHNDLNEALSVLPQNSRISVEVGPGTRNDDEIEIYPLWVSYRVKDQEETQAAIWFRGSGLTLMTANATQEGDQIDVVLRWRRDGSLAGNEKVFVHVLDDTGGVITQYDEPPGTVYYPPEVWQPGSVIEQPITLNVPDETRFRVLVGLYDGLTVDRYDVEASGYPIENQAVVLMNVAE